MSRIAYVCMSDLHLGADTSLLTRVAPLVRGQRREDRPRADVSDVARVLRGCLESLLADNERPPTLILLGDALEFALAFDEDASTTFQRFMELMMPTGHELFDDVWYVPGNHDHHQWEAARETAFADYVRWREHGKKLEEPWHATRMRHVGDEHPIASPLLTSLLTRARPDSQDIRVIPAVYPNLGLVDKDRAVVLHHGHLMESTYRMLTDIDHWAFDAPEPPWVWDLESDNFAWIDFVWSSLGRCGDAGRVNYIFGLLQDPEGRRKLIDRLAPRIAEKVPLIPLPGVEQLLDLPETLLLKFVLGRIADQAGHLGRRAYYNKHSGAQHAQRSLGPVARTYVAKYVTEQLRHECDGTLPAELTYVFGHTHTPFETAAWRPGSSGQRWQVFNTGGWVHESAELQPGIGASLVLLDEKLTPVSVRLYSETEDLPRWVRAEEPHDPHTTFFREVEERLARDPIAWLDLSAHIGAALLQLCDRFRDEAVA